MGDVDDVDYTTWDWLPGAADEVKSYILRLLEESGIKAHDVSARAKLIASFQRKQDLKNYDDPMQQMTDIVAVRVITYSITDRERVCELIRGRFEVKSGEDRNPGDEKSVARRGYDCRHVVVSREMPGVEADWLIAGGKLSRYFGEFGGLEVQVRTVAAHAWAEFEHAKRYKGAQYKAISAQDQETIDQLFGAASDARRALDETFVAIDRILARPSGGEAQEGGRLGGEVLDSPSDAGTPLDAVSLAEFLAIRFPNDQEGSDRGIAFGLDLAQTCGLSTVESLESALEAVDSDQVRALMDASGPVTRVRRFDDELLALRGEEYITATGGLGSVDNRARQLEWRFDRLRGKSRYKSYVIREGEGLAEPDAGPFTAARTVRELAQRVAQRRGVDAVLIEGAVSRCNDLPKGARAREVLVNADESIWVITNLGREHMEGVMVEILRKVSDLDLRVVRDDVVVAGPVEA